MKITKKILFLLIFALFLPFGAKAAGFYFLPQQAKVFDDETFFVEIRLSAEEKINAIEAIIEFPKEKVEAIDFITGGSAINLWTERPEIFNAKGLIKFSGGSTKGDIGDNSLLGKIMFKPKSEGSVELVYNNESRALLADGEGTPIALENLSGLYNISEKTIGLPKIISSSHPNSNKWNPNQNLTIKWDSKDDSLYSYTLSKDFGVLPDEEPEEIIGAIEYFGLEDGIYYFHLREKEREKDWSQKITFRAMIDANPPEPFVPVIEKHKTIFGGKHFLVFDSQDSASGIDFFLVCEGIKMCQKAKSPYLLENQWLGKEIRVQAVDKAGNKREVKIKPKISIPFYAWIIIIVVVALVVLIIISLVSRIKRNKNRSLQN